MADIKEFYNLDFNDLKEQFKDFISSQTEFQDFNFEGSALSQLLDIITFGIQYQQMYLNMTVNEMFLETAQIDDNIFKLANTLNYIPKRKSAAYLWAELARINDVINGDDWTGAGDIAQPDPPNDWILEQGLASHGTMEYNVVNFEGAGPEVYPQDWLGMDQVLRMQASSNEGGISGGRVAIEQVIPTTIGKNYTFSVRYLTTGNQTCRFFVWETGTVCPCHLDTGDITSGPTWTQLTFDFVATTPFTSIGIGSAPQAPYNEPVYFDEVRLTRNLSIVLNKYSKFVMGSLNLTNLEDINISTNDTQLVRLYQGDIMEETWISDGSAFQEYTLAYRDEVDNEELNILVDDPDGFGGFTLSTEPWISAKTETFEINDPAYYIRHFENLSIGFDDGQRFQFPQVNQQVRVIYLKTDGASVNGDAATVVIDPSVTYYDELTVNRVSVLENGVDEESIDGIRANAPLFYTTQNRAVTADDHNILVKRYSDVDTFFDQFLWGGELEYVEEVEDPPASGIFIKRLVEWWPTKEFPFIDVGHVYVTALKDDLSYLNQTEIDDLVNFLNITKIVAIFYRFLDPQIVHIAPTINIKHESVLNLSTQAIAEQIDTWLNDNLEGFNKVFHLSNLCNFVDSIPEVIETSITYTTRVTVKDTGYVAVRLFNAVVPGSVNAIINGLPLTDVPIDAISGELYWDGNLVGTISYQPPVTPQYTGLTGGFMIINQDVTSFGLAPDSTYDVNFEYEDNRTVELNRETFMQFDPIILNAEVYVETN